MQHFSGHELLTNLQILTEQSDATLLVVRRCSSSAVWPKVRQTTAPRKRKTKTKTISNVLVAVGGVASPGADSGESPPCRSSWREAPFSQGRGVSTKCRVTFEGSKHCEHHSSLCPKRLSSLTYTFNTTLIFFYNCFYRLGLRFLVRLCTDIGLREVQEYATKLKRLEKMKEIREQVSHMVQNLLSLNFQNVNLW